LDDFQAIAAALAADQLSQKSIEQRLGFHVKCLDAVFYKLLRKSEHIADPEVAAAYLELALKFQAAERKTLVAIANIRTPKPSLSVQNYIESQLNQLLIAAPNHDERLDTGTHRITAAESQKVETLGESDRAKDGRREDEIQLEFAEFARPERANRGTSPINRAAREALRKLRRAEELPLEVEEDTLAIG
jgi:hypothetical protein